MRHSYHRIVGTTVSGVSNRDGPNSFSADSTDDGIQNQYIVVEEHSKEVEERKCLYRSNLVADLVDGGIIENTTLREEVGPVDDSVPRGRDPQDPENEKPDYLKNNHRSEHAASSVSQNKEQWQGHRSYAC